MAMFSIFNVTFVLFKKAAVAVYVIFNGGYVSVNVKNKLCRSAPFIPEKVINSLIPTQNVDYKMHDFHMEYMIQTFIYSSKFHPMVGDKSDMLKVIFWWCQATKHYTWTYDDDVLWRHVASLGHIVSKNSRVPL